MEATAQPDNVIAALALVMKELPGIGKDDRATPQQGGYAYRGIEAITREVQPLFAKYGIVVTPHAMLEEIVDIEVNGRPWTDTRLLVSYTVYGPGGADDRIEAGPILAIGRDNSDKGANKCMTQAFKYLLLQLLCISDSDDDSDGTTHEADSQVPPETTTRPAPKTRSAANPVSRTSSAPETASNDDPATMDLRTVTAALEAAQLPLTGNLMQKRLALTEYRAGVKPALQPQVGDEEMTEPWTEPPTGEFCTICGDLIAGHPFNDHEPSTTPPPETLSGSFAPPAVGSEKTPGGASKKSHGLLLSLLPEDREDRLQLAAGIVGHVVASTNDLNQKEVSALIDYLKEAGV
jgi:hypothetical protein